MSPKETALHIGVNSHNCSAWIPHFEPRFAAGLYRGCQAQIGTAVTKSGILLATKEQLFRYTMLLILMSRGRHKLPAAAA